MLRALWAACSTRMMADWLAAVSAALTEALTCDIQRENHNGWGKILLQLQTVEKESAASGTHFIG